MSRFGHATTLIGEKAVGHGTYTDVWASMQAQCHPRMTQTYPQAIPYFAMEHCHFAARVWRTTIKLTPSLDAPPGGGGPLLLREPARRQTRDWLGYLLCVGLQQPLDSGSRRGPLDPDCRNSRSLGPAGCGHWPAATYRYFVAAWCKGHPRFSR
jgi:hypothetical protein